MKVVFSLCLLLLFVSGCGESARTRNGEPILCSTRPALLLTRSIVEGIDDISVESLLPVSMGCPHDYNLTAHDLRRLKSAKLFIVNGGGMEPWLASLDKQVPNLPLLILVDGKDEEPDHAHDHDHGHEHGDEDHANAHQYLVPEKLNEMRLTILDHLRGLYPEHKTKMKANFDLHSEKLLTLENKIKKLSPQLSGNCVLSSSEEYAPLFEAVGMDLLHASPGHHYHELSAGEITKVLDAAKQKGALAVVGEQHTTPTEELLANESGLPLIRLYSMTKGESGDSSDKLFEEMVHNIEILARLAEETAKP